MNRIISFLTANPIANSLITLLVYAVYALLIGLSLTPSVCLTMAVIRQLDFILLFHDALLLAITLGVAFYMYLFSSILVLGTAQRLLSLGFREGRYAVDSPLVARWLFFSGLHVIMINTVLPLVAGTPFNRLYYRILGCKLGKNVFINTPGLHDAYLLELGDNVVIGGKADITCHIFEGGHLQLGRIRIGDNTLIGSHTLIQPGVTIGRNCSIGIYCHIRKGKEIPDGTVLAAVPGMPMKSLARLERLLKPEEREPQSERHQPPQ